MRVVRCPARNSMCAGPVVRPRPPWEQTLSGPCKSEPQTQTTCNIKATQCYTHKRNSIISYSSYSGDRGVKERIKATHPHLPHASISLPPLLSSSFRLFASFPSYPLLAYACGTPPLQVTHIHFTKEQIHQTYN